MYGLIGFPLGHSFSPGYFREKFARLGIDEQYELFPVESVDELRTLLAEIPNLKGINVTIPHKQAVIPHLDSLSEAAREIGAVNVIRIRRNDSGLITALEGDNSDWIGFADSLRPLLRPDVKRALVLGTGGASKAVAFALRKLSITPTLVSRKADPVNGIISYQDITPEILKESLLIVNTTPLGMMPNVHTAPEIDYELLSEQHICYDLVYNPETTEFMKRATLRGATVKSGLEMLHLQADAAWEIWNK